MGASLWFPLHGAIEKRQDPYSGHAVWGPCSNMFEHSFKQVPATFQVPQIQKAEQLNKNQESKIGECYHDADADKNYKNTLYNPRL